MSDTIKTILRTFEFNTRTPEGRDAWREFEAARKAGPPCHGPVAAAVYFPFRDLDGVEVTLETKHLFNNQWNTACGRRVFDFALESDFGQFAPSGVRRGHWLEQTAEMRDLRRNTNACGYCGHQEAVARGSVFCPKCIGSEYLTEKDLHLTRMCPVDEYGIGLKNRPPLSKAESAHLLPLFVEAQTFGNNERDRARIAAKRKDILRRRDVAIKNANAEFDGLTWLMDQGLKTENVIYYGRTGRFSFGWRTKLSAGEVSRLLEVIGEFPGSYDIHCDDGRTLSGN